MTNEQTTKTNSETEAQKNTSADASHAKRLIDLCQAEELFHDTDGKVFATIRVNDHCETWAIDGMEFKNWLRHQFYKKFGNAPSHQGFQDALANLTAKALFEGKTNSVHLRTAWKDGKVYVDLCNSKWSVVEISKDGWAILNESPVKFRRSKKMRALPNPEFSRQEEKIYELKRFLNIASDDDFKLIIAFLVNALNPSGPFLILVLYGEQGTAKSTTVKVIRSLVDPNEVPLRREPRNSDDLMVSAKNNWLVAIDNMSHLPDWLSDDFCRLATGGGLSKREHYTNDDEFVLEAKRPIILNGISEFVARGDLASRSVTLNLPLISEEGRQREETFWKDFECVRPILLGCIFDGISTALRERESLKFVKNLRMADAWHWASASESSFGWSSGDMLQAYQANALASNETVLSSSLIFPYLKELAKTEWIGSPTDLLSKLNSMRGSSDYAQQGWPQRPRGLTDQIRRINPALRMASVEIILDQKTGGSNSERRITIREVSNSFDANVAKSKKTENNPFGDEGDAEKQESSEFDFFGPENLESLK